MRDARDILAHDYASPPSLDRLARLVGLNRTKLKRGFRQQFNTGISTYVRQYRMEQARRLLGTGELNVSEVAYRVGYSERSHFARAFTRQFKCPPSTFVKMARSPGGTRDSVQPASPSGIMHNSNGA